MRQSDLAILASGGVSHTSDGRITASADETLSDWELRITDAQTKDSVCVLDTTFRTLFKMTVSLFSFLQGLYECQVNTEPKINWPVTLHVEG